MVAKNFELNVATSCLDHLQLNVSKCDDCGSIIFKEDILNQGKMRVQQLLVC